MGDEARARELFRTCRLCGDRLIGALERGQVFVQIESETNAVAVSEAGGFVAAPVLFEALCGGSCARTDVDPGDARVTPLARLASELDYIDPPCHGPIILGPAGAVTTGLGCGRRSPAGPPSGTASPGSGAGSEVAILRRLRDHVGELLAPDYPPCIETPICDDLAFLAALRRSVFPSSALRKRIAFGVISTASSSRRNSSAWSRERFLAGTSRTS